PAAGRRRRADDAAGNPSGGDAAVVVMARPTGVRPGSRVGRNGIGGPVDPVARLAGDQAGGAVRGGDAHKPARVGSRLAVRTVESLLREVVACVIIVEDFVEKPVVKEYG